MRILFLHPNFPGQFRHLATALGRMPEHEVVFGTMRVNGSIPGVRTVRYAPTREVNPQTHHYLRSQEQAVLQGQAVYRMAQQLKAAGFIPDVVYGHSGWGPTLFMKDIFPTAQLHCYFEWFYHAHGSDADFDPSDPMSEDATALIRMKNGTILTDLTSCDRALCPTRWQQQQFPKELRSKLKVLHDGIDTTFFQPNPDATLQLPSIGLDLSQADEIVTYATRGMEPYRGFPQFMKAIALLMQRRPNCHVVIAGEDRVAYGRSLPDGKTYKQQALETLPFDPSRLHFTGVLAYPDYLKLLQVSSAHVYLTRPFVLSWSMLEAMSTGCMVVGSDTAPVREVIRDGKNGLLVDFFDVEAIAHRIEDALDHRDDYAAIRTNARKTILKHYDLAKLLPQHRRWLTQNANVPASSIERRTRNKHGFALAS